MTCTTKRNRHFANSSDVFVDNRMSSTTSVIDVFGNLHRLAIEFPANLDQLAVRVVTRGSHEQAGTATVGKRATRSETHHTESRIVETVEEECFPYPMPNQAPGYLSLPRLPSVLGSRRAATPWTRLSAFRVELVKSESPGLIRTRVEVSLQALNAEGTQVTILDDELETILTLVDHKTGEPLSSEWEISHATEPVDPVDIGSPRASSFRYFYVSCSGGQATRVKLCAYVKCRDGWLHMGNIKSFDECGHEESGYSGRFEEIASVAPEDATISQFPWAFDTLPGGNGNEEQPPTNPDTVRRYTLSYTDKRGNATGIRYLQIAPEYPLPPAPPEGKFRSAMIQWHDQAQGEHRACFTGYAEPGSTTLVWDETLPKAGPERRTLHGGRHVR